MTLRQVLLRCPRGPGQPSFCSAALPPIFVDVTVRRELETVLHGFKNDKQGARGYRCAQDAAGGLKGGATAPLFLCPHT